MPIQLVELPTGVSLEVELTSPSPLITESTRTANKLAICLHPWSWLGGQKGDPVLLSLTDKLDTKNYHVLRYNSRGVGKSTGWPSFTGLSEAEDLQELVKWALGVIPSVTSLVLIGYSHGSLIASFHPTLPRIKTSHILISYPLGPRGWLTLFHTKTYAGRLRRLTQDVDSNVLIIYGDEDEFTSTGRYRLWKEMLEREVEGNNGGQLKFIELAGASHFWGGHAGRILQQEVEEWLP